MPGWNDELERASNLVLRDIQNPARELLIQWRKYVSPACTLHSVRDKYSGSQYSGIESMLPPTVL